MGKNQNKPLSPEIIANDREALIALKKLRGYAPANTAILAEAIMALEAHLRQTEEEEIEIEQSLTMARNARIAAGWDLHNAILLVKLAVASQYGPDSDEIQSLGLKKKSNYRSRVRRAVES